MGYASLAECVADLEKHGQLRRIDTLLDPCLEIAYIQRRAFQAGAPALLFTRLKGCRFPMLANLYGTRERVNFIFRDSLNNVKAIFEARADLRQALRKPVQLLRMAQGLRHARPAHIGRNKAPVLAESCKKSDLPNLVSWKDDGGSFITLPLVYSEDPETGAANLGMYRIQLAGNEYSEEEAGLHYQLQRGIGIHHAKALSAGTELPVNIHIGGPPALTIAAVMPLPEGMNELIFAGVLGNRRIRLANGNGLPILADADFALECTLGNELKPEGPFGDHLGYYSLKHPFPLLKIELIHHRKDAIWPFTSVGRPPQEDTVFGDFIHELTAPLVSKVFEGVRQIHAVDAAGVHPLLLALGTERYTAWDACRKPRELLVQAMHLLGTTQTALAKYILIAASEDAPGLNVRDVPAFLRHILERTDFSRDLHFFTQSTCDTLDYSGYALHEGSRLIWAAAGPKRRQLGTEPPGLPDLPPGFGSPVLILPGILAINGPPHTSGRNERDAAMTRLCESFQSWHPAGNYPLVVVVDDSTFCAASLGNFLWVAFTRSDPARDSYGPDARTVLKHWQCTPPLILDARLKSFQAPALEDDPALAEYIEMLASRGGPLEGLF